MVGDDNQSDGAIEKAQLKAKFADANPANQHQHGRLLEAKERRADIRRRTQDDVAELEVSTKKERLERSVRLALQLLLTDLEAKISANAERLALLEGYHDALSQHRDRLIAGDDIELNADRSLADAMAEAAIREYEGLYRVRIDRTDARAVHTVMTYFAEEAERTRDDQEHLEQKRADVLALSSNGFQFTVDDVEESADPSDERSVSFPKPPTMNF